MAVKRSIFDFSVNITKLTARKLARSKYISSCLFALFPLHCYLPTVMHVFMLLMVLASSMSKETKVG